MMLLRPDHCEQRGHHLDGSYTTATVRRIRNTDGVILFRREIRPHDDDDVPTYYYNIIIIYVYVCARILSLQVLPPRTWQKYPQGFFFKPSLFDAKKSKQNLIHYTLFLTIYVAFYLDLRFILTAPRCYDYIIHLYIHGYSIKRRNT